MAPAAAPQAQAQQGDNAEHPVQAPSPPQVQGGAARPRGSSRSLRSASPRTPATRPVTSSDHHADHHSLSDHRPAVDVSVAEDSSAFSSADIVAVLEPAHQWAEAHLDNRDARLVDLSDRDHLELTVRGRSRQADAPIPSLETDPMVDHHRATPRRRPPLRRHQQPPPHRPRRDASERANPRDARHGIPSHRTSLSTVQMLGHAGIERVMTNAHLRHASEAPRPRPTTSKRRARERIRSRASPDAGWLPRQSPGTRAPRALADPSSDRDTLAAAASRLARARFRTADRVPSRRRLPGGRSSGAARRSAGRRAAAERARAAARARVPPLPAVGTPPVPAAVPPSRSGPVPRRASACASARARRACARRAGLPVPAVPPRPPPPLPVVPPAGARAAPSARAVRSRPCHRFRPRRRCRPCP